MQFATGRSRRELLRETTFVELLSLYEYAVDWVLLQATANAGQIARIFAGKRGTMTEQQLSEQTNGIEQLMTMNPGV